MTPHWPQFRVLFGTLPVATAALKATCRARDSPVLYKLITGKRPFGNGDPDRVLLSMKRGTPELAGDVPGDLARLIGALLALEPRDRATVEQALGFLDEDAVASCEEVGAWVRAWDESLPAENRCGTTVKTLPALPGPTLRMLPGYVGLGQDKPTTRRQWLRWVVVATGLVLLLALSGYALWPSLGVHLSSQQSRKVQELQGAQRKTLDEPAMAGRVPPSVAVPRDVLSSARPSVTVPADAGTTDLQQNKRTGQQQQVRQRASRDRSRPRKSNEERNYDRNADRRTLL